MMTITSAEFEIYFNLSQPVTFEPAELKTGSHKHGNAKAVRYAHAFEHPKMADEDGKDSKIGDDTILVLTLNVEAYENFITLRLHSPGSRIIIDINFVYSSNFVFLPDHCLSACHGLSKCSLTVQYRPHDA